MAVTTQPIEIDWDSTLAELRRRVASQVRNWSAADVEDCAQDAALRVVRFVQREGWPLHPQGLFSVIARRAAIDFIRVRARRATHEPFDEDRTVVAVPRSDELGELREEVMAKALRVLHYFRVNHARCEPLARARADGVDLRAFAEGSGQSHGAVLQQWSRCRKHLFESIRRGELPWPWPADLV